MKGLPGSSPPPPNTASCWAARIRPSSTPGFSKAMAARSAASDSAAACLTQAISAGDFVTRNAGIRAEASTVSIKPARAAASLSPSPYVSPWASNSTPSLRPSKPEVVEHGGEVMRRRGRGRVLPDPDIVDIGRVPRLAKIGRAGQQRGAAVGADVEALEEAEAERVVAGQPIHAVLREEQHAVELPRCQRAREPQPCGVPFRWARNARASWLRDSRDRSTASPSEIVTLPRPRTSTTGAAARRSECRPKQTFTSRLHLSSKQH